MEPPDGRRAWSHLLWLEAVLVELNKLTAQDQIGDDGHDNSSQWHADAVLDRLVHNAHRIDLNGESMRRTRKPARKA